ncbi:MAG: winged helix-turn-helix domain-containing protein [Candidatus Aenigmarchaeota archaeon]|nr:winged helix-turn-helix domain-containing protein [Candidatus Aenigmarchaeota archaeon]
MKKAELVYNYILEQALEKKRRRLTQAEIAKALGVSLSIVNVSIGHLRKMGAVRVKPRGFDVVDVRKILYFWASARNVRKDIVYSTRVDRPVGEIEKAMPPGVVYAAYTAYKMKFKDVPADYSEVYVYDNGDIEKIKKRFPPSKNRPNLFVLKRGPDRMTTANIFVDLWNMTEWYAKDFLAALEARMHG